MLWFNELTIPRIIVPKLYSGMMNSVLDMLISIFPWSLHIEIHFKKLLKYVWGSEIGEDSWYIMGIISKKVTAAAMGMTKKMRMVGWIKMRSEGGLLRH